ncbi:MAG: Tetracycline resistance protein, class B [Chlamydiae bacterium]|nr:Tetracycline resistance protein, class B [Chlamydiota bacterium]
MSNRKGTFFAIYFAYFLDYFGYAIVFGIFGPLLLNPEFGMFPMETSSRYRNVALGVLFAVFPLVQLITAPIFGSMADHFGRKRTFYLLNIGAMFGYFLSGLAITMSSFPLLLFSRIITGAFSSRRCICMAALSDLSPDEKSRSKSYGIIATLGGLSWIISILAGGFISQALTPAVPFWITTFFSLISLGTIILFFHETSDEKRESFNLDPLKGLRNIGSCFQIKGIRSLYLFYFFMMMGWGINLLWLNPYTLSHYHISNQALFILLASTGVVWSFGSSVLNKLLIKRYKPQEIARIGTVGLLIVFILCSISNTFIPFAIFALLASAFGALAWTNALSAISLAAPENIQGKIMGISQSFGSISFLLAPLIAGVVAGVDLNFVYPLAALFILISIGILSLSMRKQRLATSPRLSQPTD